MHLYHANKYICIFTHIKMAHLFSLLEQVIKWSFTHPFHHVVFRLQNTCISQESVPDFSNAASQSGHIRRMQRQG